MLLVIGAFISLVVASVITTVMHGVASGD